MNQSQQIELLNSIMPQIISTKDPEATMLKCARQNNLSPAQLGRLGQVYNTMKTLVGLEKQANRGDSFSIVDVPEMVSKYTTYDATAELSNKAENVHAKVDALTKDADVDGWGALFTVGNATMRKAAGVNATVDNSWLYESNRSIPRIHDWLDAAIDDKGGYVDFVGENQDEWQEAKLTEKREAAQLQKAASAVEEVERARDCWRQIQYEAGEEIKVQCKELFTELLQGREKWAALVMDARDVMGEEKAAAALTTVEAYFAKERCRGFEKAASIDRGYTPSLAHDSTGLIPILEEINELSELVEKTTRYLTPGTEKNASVGLPFVPPTDDLVQQMTAISRPPKDNQLKYDSLANGAKRQTALEHLLLNDNIISEADPVLVQDLHATISALSPTVAEDPIRLAPVLKEALQYDALPMQQIKDLLSIEESAQKIKKLNRENTELIKKTV